MVQSFQCSVEEPRNTDVLAMCLPLKPLYHHKSELDVISLPVVGFVRLKYIMQVLRDGGGRLVARFENKHVFDCIV